MSWLITGIKNIVSIRPAPFDTGWIDVGGIDYASAYTALDAVGDPFSLKGLPKAGEIRTVLLMDEDKEEIATVLHLFSELLENPTADDAAFKVFPVDLTKQIGEIQITNADYSTSDSSSLATVGGLGLQFTAPKGPVYCQLKTLGAPNIAALKRLAVRFQGIGYK